MPLTMLLLTIFSCSNAEDTINPPTASFTSSSTEIMVEESIQFTSTSTGDIESYSWAFEGGTPSTSTQQNPEITYSTPGVYDVKLEVSNEAGSNSKMESDYIEVSCNSCSEICPELCNQKLVEDEIILVDGAERTYDVFLPSKHDIMENLPVIINLHGTTGNKTLERSLTEFEPIAEENKIVMVYPQGSVLPTCNIGPQPRWNGNLFDAPDDIDFISSLIDKIISDYNVDANRIYVVGRSNGGFMAYTLACELSEKVAAIASVAGAFTKNNMDNNCNANRVVPVLEIHGTADKVNSYAGFSNCEGIYAGVDEVIEFWRAKAGCSAEFTEFNYPNINTTDDSTAKKITYNDCNNQVQLIVIENGGHTYPGSKSFEAFFGEFSDLLWPINFDIHASEEIWKFFKDFSLD